MEMNKNTGMLVIIGICLLVLFMGLLRQKAEFLVNFLVRGLLGIIGIYLCNMALAELGIACAVGINPFSVLTVGTLGTGGLGLLYGIVFYNML